MGLGLFGTSLEAKLTSIVHAVHQGYVWLGTPPGKSEAMPACQGVVVTYLPSSCESGGKV